MKKALFLIILSLILTSCGKKTANSNEWNHQISNFIAADYLFQYEGISGKERKYRSALDDGTALYALYRAYGVFETATGRQDLVFALLKGFEHKSIDYSEECFYSVQEYFQGSEGKTYKFFETNSDADFDMVRISSGDEDDEKLFLINKEYGFVKYHGDLKDGVVEITELEKEIVYNSHLTYICYFDNCNGRESGEQILPETQKVFSFLGLDYEKFLADRNKIEDTIPNYSAELSRILYKRLKSAFNKYETVSEFDIATFADALSKKLIKSCL